MTPKHAKLSDGTSRRFTMPAKAVRESYRLGVLKAPQRVLEVGGGSLRNALWLQDRGIKVDVVEFPSVVERYRRLYDKLIAKGGQAHSVLPNLSFDAIVSTFVLGTVSPHQERLDMLSSMRKALKRNGRLVIAVRGPGDVKTKTRSGRPWRDGFVTPNGTFIKPIRRIELIEWCATVGLSPCPECNRIRSNSGIVDLVLEVKQ